MKKIVTLILTLPILWSCPAQNKVNWDNYLDGFDMEFQADLKSNNVEGASYAVFGSEETIWIENYGFENKETHEPSKASSKYLIGSLTKVFTAVAIMQLYEKGFLNLDDPIAKYLPEFTIHQRFKESEPISIRAILTHHAGIPSDIFLHKFTENPPPFQDVLKYLNTQSTCYPVGKIKSYSNLGYALLGVLIERVSGLNYVDYIKNNITVPLNMENTGFYLTSQKKDELSVPYNRTGYAAIEHPIFDIPAGGMYSTVEDLIKFGQLFICKNPILNPNTIQEMLQLQNKSVLLDLDDRSAICFNFRNKAFELGRVLEHGGATIYHNAQLYIAPDAKMGAVMLSNTPAGVSSSWRLNEQVMVEYLKQHNDLPDSVYQVEKEVVLTSIKEKNLEVFTGNYIMPGMMCKFVWLDDNLHTTIQDNSFYLVPEDDHSFVPAKRVFGTLTKSTNMWFFLEEIDHEKLFIQSMPWGDLVILGQNINSKPIPDKWKERIGKYEIINLDAHEMFLIKDLEIKEKNGFLVFMYKYHESFGNTSPVEMALDIANDFEGFTLGLGRGGGESVIFLDTPERNKQVLTYYGLKAKMIVE